MSGPLEGLRVVEIGEGPAVAYAGRNFADMGADVVKIEPPEGDLMRRWPGPEVEGAPAVFHAFHRGKASVVLDLTDTAGRAAARDLLMAADACIDGTPEGVARELAPDAPGLVVGRMTGYGEGDHTPIHEATAQAGAGWIATNGRPDFEAVRSGLPMVSHSAGASLAHAMIASLAAREDDGQGEDVEVALFDQATTLTYHYSMQYMINGERPMRVGNGSPAAAPLGVFTAADGEFQMTVAGDRVWKRFCENMLERPDLVEHPDFARNSDRAKNKTALLALLEPIFESQPRDYWIEKMRAGGVPGGPIRSIAEAVTAPESVERRLIVDAAAGGGVPAIRNPVRFSETPLADPTPAPRLGANTSWRQTR